MVLAVLTSTILMGQTLATTEDGQRVILHDDGTWDPAPDSTPDVAMKLQRFGWVESNASNDYANDYQDYFSIELMVQNNTTQDVRAVRGTIVFTDLFGDSLLRSRITISDPIPAEDTIRWNGTIDYNFMNDQHRRLRGLDESDMSLEFNDVQVIFASADDEGGTPASGDRTSLGLPTQPQYSQLLTSLSKSSDVTIDLINAVMERRDFPLAYMYEMNNSLHTFRWTSDDENGPPGVTITIAVDSDGRLDEDSSSYSVSTEP